MLVLLIKILNTNLVCDLSYKTQLLYLLVYFMRIINFKQDEPFSIVHLIIIISFIAVTASIIYIIRFKRPYCLTY